MTGKELADEVHGCLSAEAQKRIKKADVNLIVKLVFETIIESIMLGDPVSIRNFGKIAATFTPGGKLVWCEIVKRKVPRKPSLKLKIIPGKRLRGMVRSARTKMRELAKKQQEEEGG